MNKLRKPCTTESGRESPRARGGVQRRRHRWKWNWDGWHTECCYLRHAHESIHERTIESEGSDVRTRCLEAGGRAIGRRPGGNGRHRGSDPPRTVAPLRGFVSEIHHQRVDLRLTRARATRSARTNQRAQQDRTNRAISGVGRQVTPPAPPLPPSATSPCSKRAAAYSRAW